MAIPIEARRERDISAISALTARVREELEQFALAATALEGKDLELLGWGDASAALDLVRASVSA
jgi:inorganic pyrophosphatase